MTVNNGMSMPKRARYSKQNIFIMKVKMECPICGADNNTLAKRCVLCGVELPKAKDSTRRNEELVFSEDPVVLETVDVSKPVIVWKRVAWVGVALVLLALPWLLMTDLFFAPKDVILSRNNYNELKERYVVDKSNWQDRKNQILSIINTYGSDYGVLDDYLLFEDVDLAVFMAYLDDEVGLLSAAEGDVALYPELKDGDELILMLSKHEKKFWPLPVVLSLEIVLSFSNNNEVQVNFLTLRRGSRVVPVALAWQYFGPELSSLQDGFYSFSKGIRGMNVVDDPDEELKISWKYMEDALNYM